MKKKKAVSFSIRMFIVIVPSVLVRYLKSVLNNSVKKYVYFLHFTLRLQTSFQEIDFLIVYNIAFLSKNFDLCNHIECKIFVY